MSEKNQNFTKEFAFTYFQENNWNDEILLQHKYDEENILVILKKEKNEEDKKVYNFYIVLNWELVFENKNKKSRWDSLDEVFWYLYQMDGYKKNKKSNSKWSTVDDSEDFKIEDYLSEFENLIDNIKGENENLFNEKIYLTSLELDTFLTKALESKELREKIKELKELKDYIESIESNISNLKEIPEELYQISFRDKGRCSKLEKTLINRAKKVIISAYVNNINLSNEHIKEFNRRMFDYNIHHTKSPIDGSEVPLEKNLFRLAELEIKNPWNLFGSKGHKWKWVKEVLDDKKWIMITNYVTFEAWRLEKELNWSFEEILNYLVMKMKENMYFFRTDKEASLDTFMMTVIKNSLNTLRNYTAKVDSEGRQRRWKDEWVIKKLKEARFLMEQEKMSLNNEVKVYRNRDDQAKWIEKVTKNKTKFKTQAEYEFTVENIFRFLKDYNETVKDQWQRITEEDIKLLLPELNSWKISLDNFLQDDEGNEWENNALQWELWEIQWVNSWYDTRAAWIGNLQKREIDKRFENLFKRLDEQVIVELLVDNFVDVNINSWVSKNKWFKVDSDKFNKSYRKLAQSLNQTIKNPEDQYSLEELNQSRVNLLVEEVKKKIALNQALFQEVLSDSLEYKAKSDEEEMEDVDLDSMIL